MKRQYQFEDYSLVLEGLSPRQLPHRYGKRAEERRNDGRVAVDQRNTHRWSDAPEIDCDNDQKVRVVFALDGCDREAMGMRR